MAVVNLTGIWDDGTFLGAGVAANPRVPIRLTQGATLKVRVSIVNNAGEPLQLDLDPMMAIELTLKKTSIEDAATILKSGSLQPLVGPGSVEFLIGVADTRYVEPGRYLYDIWLIYLGERNAVIPTSPFLLEPSVASVP